MRGMGVIKAAIHFRRSTGVLAAKFRGVISELGGKRKKVYKAEGFRPLLSSPLFSFLL